MASGKNKHRIGHCERSEAT